jgi:hypothetical protein
MIPEITAATFHAVERYRMTWGRRYATATAPVEKNPVLEGVDATEPPSGGPNGFNLFDVYQTREQARAIANLRAQKATHAPVLAVTRIRNAQTSTPSLT